MRWILLSFALACGAFHGAMAARDSGPFEKDIAALTLLPSIAYPVRSIQFWDGAVVVSEYGLLWPIYYRIDHLEPQILTILGLDQIISLSSENGRAVAYGIHVGAPRLLRKEGPIFADVALPPELKVFGDVRLVPCDTGLALAGATKLYRYQDGQWKTIVTADAPCMNCDQFPPRRIFHSLLFTLASGGEPSTFKEFKIFDLDRTRPRNERRAVPDAPGRKTTPWAPERPPIRSMAGDTQGNFWCVCESSLGWDEFKSALYRLDGTKWVTEIEGAPGKARESRNGVPDEARDFIDVFGGPDGKLYLLVEQLGIFTYEDSVLKPVVEFPFSEIAKPMLAQDGKRADYQVPIDPQKLVADGSGNFFVTTIHYGILAFIKADGAWSLKQIVMPDAAAAHEPSGITGRAFFGTSSLRLAPSSPRDHLPDPEEILAAHGYPTSHTPKAETNAQQPHHPPPEQQAVP